MALATIVVQLESAAWTQAALTDAFAEAREIGGEIVLVKMLPDSYVAWFADDVETYHFNEAEKEELQSYQALAAANGVPLQVRVYQYHDLEQGIIRVADELNAVSVYATVPPSAIPFRHDLPMLHLEFQLQQHHHNFHAVQVALH